MSPLKKNDDLQPDVAPNSTELPYWFFEVMELAQRAEVPPVSPAFEQRCRDAALLARDLARLRREHRRREFAPVPLGDYLPTLSRHTQVALDPLLQRCGIDELWPRDGETAAALAGLAQKIGLSARETAARIRFGLAAQLGLVSAAQLVARGRGSGRMRSRLEQCERALLEIERAADPQTRAALRELAEAVNTAYAEAGE